MAVAQGSAEYLEYSNSTRLIIMGAVLLGTLMQMIDSSIVNVAIPTMMGNLGATLDQISWVTTGYILANVITLPLTGWLSGIFGRRKYLAGSMAVFTLASVLCGMSRSLGFLVFARILQGIGGAALVSTAQATMMEIFPPQQLGMVQAIYGLGVMVGPAVGPTLGGWIVDNLSWPWVFYINLPIGIVATIFTWLFMHDSRYARKFQGKIDFIGITLLAFGLGALQMLLEKGQKEGWFQSSYIIGLTACSVVCLTSFIAWELHTEHPVVQLRVLRHRGFAAGVVFGTVLGFGLYGGMFILPVYLQQMKHLSARQTGIIMLPGAIASALLMPIIGKLVGKYPPRVLTALGVIGVTVATLMLTTITMNTSTEQLFWPLVLRGGSMALLWVPLSLATLVGLKGQEIAEGTAIFNLSRQLGGSAGIAFLATFLSSRVAFHREVLTEHLSIYNSATLQRVTQMQQFFISKGASVQQALQKALAYIDLTVRGQAAILGYQDAFLITAVLFGATIFLLFFFEKGMPKGIRQKPAETSE